jgi:L,D-transpeptidase catalytic domain/Sporulation and spore germination/Putative peptidoglycan binding domain
VRRTAALLVLALALLAAPSAAHADVQVYFLQGEQLVPVDRPGSTTQDAMNALLAGPTPAETAKGFRTYVPQGTPLRSLTVADNIATVDLGLGFVTDTAADSLQARVTQVVYTLTGVPGATRAQILVEGGVPVGIVPGIVTSRPISRRYLATPDLPAPPTQQTAPPAPTAPKRSSVLAAQQRLVALGYLDPSGADGRLGPATTAAVLAFQKWEGLGRDGVIGAQTAARLRTAGRPTPVTQGGSGKRAEVLLGKQVALAIQDNQVVRVIHVSTGKPSTPTPPGDFKVYGQYPRWWSTPFREYLLWASPFNGGIAFHQYPDVPAVAASHGCVRVNASQARWLYDFLKVGVPVKVIATS